MCASIICRGYTLRLIKYEMGTHRMKSEEVLSQLPRSLQQQMRWERYNLVTKYQRLERDPAFDTRYLPQNSHAFSLPCYWIHKRHLLVFGSGAAAPPLAYLAHRERSDHLLFPVHPTALSYFTDFLRHANAEDARSDRFTLWAVPSSSTRTLLAWPDGCPHDAAFLKLSLSSPLFGDRRVLRHRAAKSIGLSAMVENAVPSLPDSIRYLREPFAVVPRMAEMSGFIVRVLPSAILNSQCSLVPLFALTGGTQPLLPAFLANGSESALDFAQRILCSSFAELWLTLTLRAGLLLEAHGQNLLLEASPDLDPTGVFFYRDFEGFYVDWRLRSSMRDFDTTGAQLPGCETWWRTYGSSEMAHPGCLWKKLTNSLAQYTQLVLQELERDMAPLVKSGLLHGPAIREGELTWTFSEAMFAELRRQFGGSIGKTFNIRHFTLRFVRLLMKIRAELLSRSPINHAS